jgi:hypothetical protein
MNLKIKDAFVSVNIFVRKRGEPPKWGLIAGRGKFDYGRASGFQVTLHSICIHIGWKAGTKRREKLDQRATP